MDGLGVWRPDNPHNTGRQEWRADTAGVTADGNRAQIGEMATSDLLRLVFLSVRKRKTQIFKTINVWLRKHIFISGKDNP